MTAGKRNRLISIERATVTTNDYGEDIPTWAEHVQTWAEVLFGTGQERREAAQETGGQAATFLCLWTPTLAAVTLRDRIQFAGSAWDITSAVPIGLNKELHFTAVRSA